MKKIDFHLHTISTRRDIDFTFNLDALKRYTSECGLDAIAITNHDVFDADQYRTIEEALEIQVYPGIEVSLENGHLLIISERASIDDFQDRTSHITERITEASEAISVTDLQGIFTDLSEYLVIPHYEKKPAISRNIINEISEDIVAGEVDSAKKFIRATKDADKLTPVLFSDARINIEMESFPTRQTFIDCGELSLDAIKTCLKDKNKVALSCADGNKLFQVFDNGLYMSTGLNVLVGGRSTGKTFTLDRINESHPRVKYIRQFDLVQRDEEDSEREFNKEVQRQRSLFAENFLSGFKSIIDNVINVDLRANEKSVENYVESLLRSAKEEDRKDAFSKTVLFDEPEFQMSESMGLKELIESVRHIIENVEYREIISKYIDPKSMKNLAIELIELFWSKSDERKKMNTVNSIMRDIRENLQMRTSAVRIEDVELYRVALDKKKIERFTEIVKSLQRKSVISEENIRGFTLRANKEPFSGASKLKKAIRTSVALSDCFSKYNNPYEYLQELKTHERLTPSDFYKLFVKISYVILNKDGYPISGGERSEFRLLQEIKDAQNYDILLIDEPESSFDNLFLKSDVNQIIKEISQSMPVVVVTHNSTIGASIGADFIIFTTKDYVGGEVNYQIYTGYPTDKQLTNLDGEKISNHEIILNSLEAGKDTYNQRKTNYEAIEN